VDDSWIWLGEKDKVEEKDQAGLQAAWLVTEEIKGTGTGGVRWRCKNSRSSCWDSPIFNEVRKTVIVFLVLIET
jgi:hypothetical protein